MGKAPPPVPPSVGAKRPTIGGGSSAKRSKLQERQASQAAGFGKSGGGGSGAVKKSASSVNSEKIWQQTFFADNFRVVTLPSDGKGHAKSLYYVWKKNVAEERLAKVGRLEGKDKKRRWNYTSCVLQVVFAQVGGGPYLMGSEEYYKKNPEDLSYTVKLRLENLETPSEPKFADKPWAATYVEQATQFAKQLKEFDELLIRALWEDPIALPEEKKEIQDDGTEKRYAITDEKAFKRFAAKMHNKNSSVKRNKETEELEWTLKTKAYRKMRTSDWARALKLTKSEQSEFKGFTTESSKEDYLKKLSIKRHGRIDPNFEAMKDDSKRDTYCFTIGYERAPFSLKEQTDPAKNRWEEIPHCKEIQETRSLINKGDYIMINFTGEPYVTNVATGTRYYMTEAYLVGQGEYKKDTAPPESIGATARYVAPSDDAESEDDDNNEPAYPPQPYPPSEEEEAEAEAEAEDDEDADMDEDASE